MGEDLANTIYEERLQVGWEMVKRFCEFNKIHLSEGEMFDGALRISASLFIEKNRAFREKNSNR